MTFRGNVTISAQGLYEVLLDKIRPEEAEELVRSLQTRRADGSVRLPRNTGWRPMRDGIDYDSSEQ